MWLKKWYRKKCASCVTLEKNYHSKRRNKWNLCFVIEIIMAK